MLNQSAGFLCEVYIVIDEVLNVLRGQFCSSFKSQEQNLKHNSIINWQPMKPTLSVGHNKFRGHLVESQNLSSVMSV